VIRRTGLVGATWQSGPISLIPNSHGNLTPGAMLPGLPDSGATVQRW
jgi:hypothetical protein